MQFSTIQKNMQSQEPDSAGLHDRNVIHNIEIDTGSKQKQENGKSGLNSRNNNGKNNHAKIKGVK